MDPEDLKTAQELWFGGSTPSKWPKKQNEWYIPQAVIKGDMTLGEVIKLRKMVGHFESSMLSSILGFNRGNLVVSVGFSEINKETGMTVNDPKIEGLWDQGKERMEKVEGRDLTQEAYVKFKELEVDLQLRLDKTLNEGQNSPKEQKG